MYQGHGLNALFSVALGLREAAREWTDDAIFQECRLGPVVAKHGNRVYKAYDDANYRSPNLETVKTMLDSMAVLWESMNGKLLILEMEFKSSKWDSCSVPVGVFCDVMDKLKQLHEDGKVHGDIRLANLLNCEKKGYIIDFDFVHQKFYPE
eukprot:scaffold13742_cov157-Amphora_coffeaeformis.AAC.9